MACRCSRAQRRQARGDLACTDGAKNCSRGIDTDLGRGYKQHRARERRNRGSATAGGPRRASAPAQVVGQLSDVKALEDEPDHRGFGDLAKHAQPTAAPRTPEHVNLKRTLQKIGPVNGDASLARRIRRVGARARVIEPSPYVIRGPGTLARCRTHARGLGARLVEIRRSIDAGRGVT